MEYIVVGFFAALGALSRQGITDLIGDKIGWSILLINIVGSFLFTWLVYAKWFQKLTNNIRKGITTGFLGGFTTFSTFCSLSYDLYLKQQYTLVIIYIILTASLTLGGAYLGYLISNYQHDNPKEVEV